MTCQRGWNKSHKGLPLAEEQQATKGCGERETQSSPKTRFYIGYPVIPALLPACTPVPVRRAVIGTFSSHNNGCNNLLMISFFSRHSLIYKRQANLPYSGPHCKSDQRPTLILHSSRNFNMPTSTISTHGIRTPFPSQGFIK